MNVSSTRERTCGTTTTAMALSALVGVLALAALLSGCATLEKCNEAACMNDQKITAQVRTVFHQHPDLGTSNRLDVMTRDHVVYLSGPVSTDLERQLAESYARQVLGVESVVNSIYAQNK